MQSSRTSRNHCMGEQDVRGGPWSLWSITVGLVVVGNKSGGRMRLGFHLTQGDQPSRCAWDWRVSQDMELSVLKLGKSWATGINWSPSQ